MLKSNVSSMVGHLYSQNDLRRDAGFSIFYMGINIGSLIAPIIVGALGQNVNYHLGFSIAAIGMFFGLLQYYFQGKKTLHNIGTQVTNPLVGAENSFLSNGCRGNRLGYRFVRWSSSFRSINR